MSYYLQKKNFPTWHAQYTANDTTWVDLSSHLATAHADNNKASYGPANNYLFKPSTGHDYMKATNPYFTQNGSGLVYKNTGSYAEKAFTNNVTIAFGWAPFEYDGSLEWALDHGSFEFTLTRTSVGGLTMLPAWNNATPHTIASSGVPFCVFFEITGGGGGGAGGVGAVQTSNQRFGGGGGGGAGIYGILDFTNTDTFYVKLGLGGAAGGGGSFGSTSGTSGGKGNSSWLEGGSERISIGGGSGGTVSSGGSGGSSYKIVDSMGVTVSTSVAGGWVGDDIYILGKKNGAAGGAGGTDSDSYKTGSSIDGFNIAFGNCNYAHPTMAGGSTTGYKRNGSGGGASLTHAGTNGGNVSGYSLPWGWAGGGAGGGTQGNYEGGRGGDGGLVLRW